jgi:hypothetical protein
MTNSTSTRPDDAGPPRAPDSPPQAGPDQSDRERRTRDTSDADPSRRGSTGWGLALIAAGGFWLLWQLGVPIAWEYVLPGAVVVVGLALLLGLSRGASGGLVALGIVLLAASIVVSVLPSSVTWSAGDRSERVTDVAQLEPEYTLGAGSLVLDLRALDLGGETAEVAARVGMGDLLIRVPPRTNVVVDARSGMGEVVVLGREEGGISRSISTTEGAARGDSVLVLDLQVGLGKVEVSR